MVNRKIVADDVAGTQASSARMDEDWFAGLPRLSGLKKYDFEEINVLLGTVSERAPVAVKANGRYYALQKVLWPLGREATEALQGLPPIELDAGKIRDCWHACLEYAQARVDTSCQHRARNRGERARRH